MSLGADVVAVAKQYLGPAASAFLSREARELGVTPESLTPAHVVILAQHAKRSALKLMDAGRADELARALAACATRADSTGTDERAGRIALLREAVALAPVDLTAHRRLAASLANAGDLGAACAEYGRFVDAILAQGDGRRAFLEIAYARETLGERPDVLALVDKLAPLTSSPALAAAAAPAGAAAAKTTAQGPLAAATAPAPTVRPNVAAATPAPSVTPPPPVAATKGAAEPELDLETADWRAMALIGARNPAATPATLRTARRLLDENKLQAASDLLLDYIGAGYADREAQRLLIEVDRGIGRKEIAREKCRLLGAAYRLDGRIDSASDVERFATFI